MKVFTILIILLSVFSFSTYSLRLSNLGKVIASEAALIPTVKQISTYELSKINFASDYHHGYVNSILCMHADMCTVVQYILYIF